MQVVIFKGKKVRLANHYANLLLKSGKAELPKKEKAKPVKE